MRSGIGNVRRHDQHGNAAFGQSGLAGCNRLAAGLLGRQDHLAKDTAALVHLNEIDLLDRFEAQILPYDLACDQDDGRTVATGFVKPVDEVETAGAARACAGCEAAGELSFGARRGTTEMSLVSIREFGIAGAASLVPSRACE
jgi:hypothetical protein